MDLSKYQELTGIAVASSDSGRITAQIARVQSMLETLLGFTLDPDSVATNLYNELGKTQSECSCPNVVTETLDDPDAVEGAYRMFKYNNLDRYFHVDPFSTLYKVKLVYVRPGDSSTNPQGVTIKTFTADEIRVDMGRDAWAKYIEHCQHCLCICTCEDCVQLAVDADWLWPDATTIPNDLLYVWADMVDYYADPKKDIKSESITTHSYTKANTTAPELEPHNLSVIKKYAGPHGSATVMPVAGVSGRRI